MNANLFEQTRSAQLSQALKDYESAKQNYQRLLRQAVAETDSKKRTEALKAVEAENARLIQIVEGLVRAITEGNREAKRYPPATIDKLNKEIARYKEDVEYIRNKNDTVIQLRELLASVTYQSDTDRKQYYGYIVGILVLLIVVFIFFVYSYASSVISSVSEAISAPVSDAITE